MSDVGILGREVVVTMGGASFVGLITKGLSYAMSLLDTTDDTSSGNAEYHSSPGRVDRTMSFSGKMKNLDWIRSLETNLANGQNKYAITITWPDGTTTNSELAGNVAVGSFSTDNPHEELATYEMEVSFSGTPVFTPAT